VRRRACQLLGRDSESLSDRMFVRILKDAHDEGIVDLRRRGNDFEVARAAEAAPVSEQLARHETAATTASTAPAAPAGPRLGMGPRGARTGPMRGRPGAPPPELLSIGVVEDIPAAVVSPREEEKPAADNGTSPAARGKRAATSRGRGARGKSGRATPAASAAPIAAAPTAAPAAKAKRGRAGAKTGGPAARAKKRAPAADHE